MTDNPRTLQFDVAEWRDLCLHKAQRIAKDMERFDRPSDAEVADIARDLDRMKLFLTGWSRAGIVAPLPTSPTKDRCIALEWQESMAQAKGEEVAYSVAHGGLVPTVQGRPAKLRVPPLNQAEREQARKLAAAAGIEQTDDGIALAVASVPLNGPAPRKRGRPRKVVQPDVPQ